MSVLVCFRGINLSQTFSIKGTIFFYHITKSISPKKIIFFKKQNKNGHRSASLTVEAAMTLPLFFYTSFILWQCFLLLLLQISVCQEVTTVVLTSGSLGYLEQHSEKEGMAFLYRPLLWNALQSEERMEQLQIEVKEEEDGIRAKIQYDFLCETVVLPMIRIPVSQSFYFASYTGETVPDLLGEEEGKKDIVYVTTTGTVYHESKSCVYLSVHVTAVAYEQLEQKRNSSGRRYTECSRCVKEKKTEQVYVSAGGERYHYSADCPALKRIVQEKERSEVALPPCSKCGERTEK